MLVSYNVGCDVTVVSLMLDKHTGSDLFGNFLLVLGEV